MRNLFIISLLLFSLFPHKIFSQQAFEREYVLGVSGGINYSRVMFEPSVSQKMLSGQNGNIFFRYIGEKHKGLQLQFGYNEKGWSEKYNNDSIYKRKNQYAEAALLTYIYFGEKNGRLYFTLGPVYGKLIDDKIETNFIDTIYYRTHDLTFEDDFSISFSAGYSYKTKIGSFQIDLKYNHQLNNILETDIKKRRDFFYSQNQVISINFGYYINF